MVRQHPRRLSRVDSLEQRYGRPADDANGWTVGDILDAHPELTGPMVTLWERRHEVHGDLQAAEAALAVWLALRGGPFDESRPTRRTEEEPWR